MELTQHQGKMTNPEITPKPLPIDSLPKISLELTILHKADGRLLYKYDEAKNHEETMPTVTFKAELNEDEL